ncbi:MAG: hypothetical protein JO055_15250, partial [Alphaproteobacteria bacterium]|nr:hypothetical protein [Alphaproteobacteria bacterium]
MNDTSLSVRLIGVEGPCLFSRTALERARRMFPGVDVGDETRPIPGYGRVLLLRADNVLDDVLAKPLMTANDLALTSSNTPHVAAIVVDVARATECRVLLDGMPDDCARAGLAITTPRQLAGAYRAKLRNRVPPYALLTSATTPREIERV